MIQKPEETPGRAYRRLGVTYVLLNVEDEEPIEVVHGLGEIPLEVSIAASESTSSLKSILVLDAERVTLQIEGAPVLLRLRIV